jgi:hypothetical protein
MTDEKDASFVADRLIALAKVEQESALAQAEERGRIAGLREAEIYRKLTPEHARIIIEDTDLTWHQCVPQEAVDALKEIAAITSAAEGKNPPKEIDPNKWAFDRGLESY